jgi:hypothetical protein
MTSAEAAPSMKGQNMSQPKDTYIPEQDRPTGYDLDTPVGSLRVRDLASILDRLSPRLQKIHPKLEGHSPLKEFFDKSFPEVLAPIERSALGVSDIDQVVQSLTRLTDRVEELMSRVDDLDRRVGGGG